MISTLTLAARLVLAAVFAVAGAAKLADREGTRKAVVGFGAAERFAGMLAVLLPVAELTVAGLLLPGSSGVYGAAGSVLLLALFTVAIAWNLARGRAPDCHCFGQLHSATASRKTLARNVGLTALAAFSLVGGVVEPEASAITWIGELGGAALLALILGLIAAALLAVGSVAFVSLVRSYGTVLVRLERLEAAVAGAGTELGVAGEVPQLGLEPGTRAPHFSSRSVRAETISVETLTSFGLPSLLVFTSPQCGPCNELLPAAAEWQREHSDRLTIVFAVDGSEEEARLEAETFGLANVLVDDDRHLATAFEGNGTPSAVLIDPDGTIGSWLAPGAEAIEQLVAAATSPEEADESLPLGAAAPALELPALDGSRVSLAELLGRDTLLLFWNPGCGFCREMHEELLAWEQSANGVTPRLVIVSSGDEESTRAEGFDSLVLLDDEYEAGTAFAANGTPMAVLIDSEGRIASKLAVGADAVLHLATARSHA
jgi:thiol-disulfide isomerase/thioredoxin